MKWNYNCRRKQLEDVQSRIDLIERTFGNLCSWFGSYHRNLAKCRDKNDLIAKELNTYATLENLNMSTKSSLVEFAKHYSSVQDHLDIKIDRLRTNVIHPLSTYDQSCKATKKSIKKTYGALKKEMQLKKQLDQYQRHNNHHHVLKNSINNAAANLSKLSHELEEQIEVFERNKLQDIKKILLSLIGAEIDFNTKSLQFLTCCYNDLESMNEDEDFDVNNILQHSPLCLPYFEWFE
ncbi:hypothetical protein HELRODRAFT_65745 [Helobdella robusta]|uniref:F-BAR domain-containing protein n=1 Tax=Helobdella robusta TaxID=6412 RepID=T1FYC2_HELRO|nr:hypothetical protein HELRODRAFT_65745 [Helobdella robusta]ESO02159.1 hypothetical protein HELRODRAFT_65745 [Helobdella robusta]